MVLKVSGVPPRRIQISTIKKFQITNAKWFDKPFDRLTVLSKAEGLTTLSQPVESLKVVRVEGQITMTEIKNSKQLAFDII
jgi:hypothetical protein